MSDQINGWLAQGGAALTGLAALAHGGVLGGIALLLLVLALAVGPELRQWVRMLWDRKDAKVAATAELKQADPEPPQIADAA